MQFGHPYDDSTYPSHYEASWNSGTRPGFEVDLVESLATKRGARSWLDAGCGVGWHVRHAPTCLTRVVGADRAEAMLERARKQCDDQRVEFVRCDMRDAGTLGRFDIVTSFWLAYIVQETLTDVYACLSGLVDAVAEGGVLFMPVWNPEVVFKVLPAQVPITTRKHPLTVDAVIWSWTEDEQKEWHHNHYVAPHTEWLQKWLSERFETVRVVTGPMHDVQPGATRHAFQCENPHIRS